MRQAILNILINAIDAMEENGGVLEINLFDQSDNIVLEIIDTGIGIPEEILDKIFDANFTTKGDKGTGLGLKVAKKAFEDCGGKVEVKSELGKGTIFTICLPIENS
ncbi:MAG: ATP-binding protein [Tissierellaceae bacterium]|nr:ATP-binding protein [Tissierellaceae bacterium]